ncbi:MAG: exocyst complex component exo70 [Icmadophila ericetorum]|nr:exocyst complex component exo70 [Icmadophila ericetorum]
MVGTRNAAFAEESAEVEVMFAEAKKFEDISKRMRASITRMQANGETLQKYMGPGYNSTGHLHTVTRNVDDMLATIEKWQKPLEGKGQDEDIIKQGPIQVGIQTYVASLKHVDQMLAELNEKKLRVNQQTIGELGQLSKAGNSRLQELFDAILKEDIQKIEPLHYITKQIPFPTLKESKVSDLVLINSCIASNPRRSNAHIHNGSPTLRVYGDMRGTYLSQSLQNLAAASVSTSRKKNPDEVYRPGTSGISTYANAIENIFVAEWQNIKAIFAREECGIAFELTTRKALTDFSKTVRDLNTQIKSSITTDCFLAYEVVDIVNKLAFRVDGKTGQLKQHLVDAVKPVRDTAKLSLYELLDDAKRRIATTISFPADGAALPLTADVMIRLQTLAAYPQPLAGILISLGDGNWLTPPSSNNNSTTSLPIVKLDIGADGNQLLAHYVLDTIEALLSGLETKARPVLKKAVLGLFMANNVAVVDRMIRSSDIQPLLASTNTPNKTESWRKKGTATYLDSWREPCASLMEVQYTNRGARPPSNQNGPVDSAAVVKQLNSKDKDAIKEKFKSFNARFEELSAKHKELGGGMEKEVRNQLAREIQAMVEPLYGRFWDRYHEIDKGKGKYVKYDKGSLAVQLANLS